MKRFKKELNDLTIINRYEKKYINQKKLTGEKLKSFQAAMEHYKRTTYKNMLYLSSTVDCDDCLNKNSQICGACDILGTKMHYKDE